MNTKESTSSEDIVRNWQKFPGNLNKRDFKRIGYLFQTSNWNGAANKLKFYSKVGSVFVDYIDEHGVNASLYFYIEKEPKSEKLRK